MGKSHREFMNERPHVLVTNHGTREAGVWLDGKLFPCIDVGWDTNGDAAPVVTLKFYGRLEVQGYDQAQRTGTCHASQSPSTEMRTRRVIEDAIRDVACPGLLDLRRRLLAQGLWPLTAKELQESVTPRGAAA